MRAEPGVVDPVPGRSETSSVFKDDAVGRAATVVIRSEARDAFGIYAEGLLADLIGAAPIALARGPRRRLIAIALVLVAWSLTLVVPAAHAQTVPPPVQTCNAQNVLGFRYAGLLCGGSVLDSCSPGALYQCLGAAATLDNCTFSQACAVGCLTGPTSTSITLNTTAPVAADACFAGPPPLTLSTNNTLGGNDVTLTATLTEPHSPFGAGISLHGGGALIPPLCNGTPLSLATDATSLSFDRPTAVVSVPTDVPLNVTIGYNDATGKGRTLVSVPSVLTLNPGGTQLPATVASFTLTPSTVPPGQGSSVEFAMTRASTTPNPIIVTSSNPSVAFSNEQPGPTVAPGCTRASGTIWTARFVLDPTAVTIGASAQGQVPVTNVLTVTASPLALSNLTFNPTSALSGGSSVVTVTVNRPAPAGGVQVSLFTQPGILTGASLSIPPSVTIPAGQTSVSFPVTVPALTAPDALWISAQIPGTGTSGAAGLQVSPVLTVLSLKWDPVTNPTGGMISGESSTVIVTLYAPAPAGGAVVTLSTNTFSSAPTPVTVPASVTVPEGAISASFTVTANSVPAVQFVRISATLNGFTANADTDVFPVLGQVDFGFNTVLGGTSKTGTVRFRAPAPPGGAFVPLTSSNPGLVAVPPNVTVPAGATSATFTANTSEVTAFTFATVSAVYDGATVGENLFVKPPSISNLFFTPSSLVGGGTSTGTVTLDFPAAAGGSVVTLSSNLAAATVPASVTVPAGTTSATFTVSTSVVGVPTQVIITGTLGVFVRAALNLNPPPPPPPGPVLSTVSLSPTSVVGGTASTGTVTLSAPALSGGGSVSLSCNSTAATVPVSIMVPAGAISATFTVATTSVAASTSASVNAGYGGVSKSVTLTVNPGAPAAPSLVSPAVDATPAQPVTFDWSDVANATSYEIQVDDTQTIAAPFVASQVASVSQVTIGGLPAKRLWWRVRAQNAAGVFGPFSATRRFTPQAAPAAASLSAVSVSPPSVVGPASATGTVTLTAAAPTGGTVVTLASSNTAAATVPASVTVAAGATSATFAVATQSVVASTAVTITASANGTTKSAALTVNPAVACTPTTCAAQGKNCGAIPDGCGGTLTCGVCTAPQTCGGGGVANVCGAVAACTPTTCAAQGKNCGTLPDGCGGTLTCGVCTAPQTCGGGGVANVCGATATTATLALTATGRGGERVSSTPAGLNVPTGSTASASFAVGTSLTLQATNQRDVIWSGVCSSAGQKAKTCTFTLNANATETANVQ